MSYAKLFVKNDNRDLGYFHFVSTPQKGDLIAITVNEKPMTFSVEGVVHMPVIGSSFDPKKAVPTMHLIVSYYDISTAK